MFIILSIFGGLMLEALFGNSVIEKILFYLQVYQNGYSRGISKTFSIPINGIRQQLKRLEDGGIIVGFSKGRTRLYQFNPRYPFLPELKNLLQKAIDVLPQNEIKKYYRFRTRPRRTGKPL